MHSKREDNSIAQAGQPKPRDILADVFSLRRKVAVGVYAAVTLALPLYYFTGYTLMQIAMVAVLGWIIAGVSIYLAFNQIIKLRKRTSYPELLVIRLADTTGSREAAEEALFILEGLLDTNASFIAVQGLKELEVVASRGVDQDESEWVMETHSSQLETALAKRYPADVLGSGGCAAFVPIIALRRPIGVLYLTSTEAGCSIDRGLLNDIGGALGLSLENMRQKEQLLQKESRLRSVVTGAPIVLFSVNNSGVVVFQQGQAMEQVGIEPESLIGRTVWEIYADYPAILQSFRRAFAGDEVLSTATIEAAGNRVIFEYRLAPERDEHGLVTGVIGVATDITQRTRVEDALREGERFLTTLVSNLPGFVIRLEGDPSTIKYVSEGVRDITGFSAAELTDQPVTILAERLHPDDRLLMRQAVERARETGERFEYEFRFSTRAGEERWFWQQGQVVRDDDGQPIALETFTMDVTERKLSGEAMKENERFLSTLVGNLPGFVMRVNISEPRVIQYISEGVKDLLGIDAAVLLGQPSLTLGELMNQDDRAELLRRITGAGLGDGTFEHEFRVRDVQGNDKWFLMQGQIVKDARGNAVAVESFTMDVTERRRASEGLKENERFLSTLVGNLPGFVMRFNTTDPRTITYISEGVEDVLGLPAGELMGKPISALRSMMDDGDSTELIARIMEAGRTTGTFESEFRGHDASSSERWFWQHGEILKDGQGRPLAIESFTMDVTERKRAEQALEESEQRFRDIIENARDAMFSYGFDGRFISANERMAEMLGYTLEELLALDVGKVVAPDYHEIAAESLRRVFNGEQSSYEVDLITKDGVPLPIEITCRFVLDEKGDPCVVQGIGRDISERRQAEETIRRLAYHDSLTGLPNRALFEDRLHMALAQAKRHGEMLGVLFLDVDGFKLVNDTLGHTAGDRLLQLVAGDLAALVRDCDTVARVGGDEFTILIPAVDQPEDITEVAQRILECLRQPRLIAGEEFRATASIGITTYPADGDDGETLLRNADTAMYRAKDNGRDHYQLFTPAMNKRVADRLSFEQSLRQALIRDELTVFYQPIVDVISGRVVAAEALVRWFHPSRGLVAPDDFIPLAEETGIILDIGEFVLREATKQLVQWREEGLELNRVTVNVSARQLQQEDLVSRVSRVLEETGIESKRVQLEITEGAVLKNVDYAIAMLRELRDMGVGIALDDFGTGYSSLTYLKRFPVDAVKIDRTFVRDLDHDAHDATIVSTVIGMAQNLGLRVIAEGVETPQQLEFLRARRCAEYQGYLFSRPVPPEEFPALAAPPVAGANNGTRRKNGRVAPAADAGQTGTERSEART